MTDTPADSAPEPPPPETPVDLETFLEATTLAELRAAYSAGGATFADEDAFTRAAQRDFFRLALYACRTQPEPPTGLPSVEVTCGKHTFAVYGVIHGMLGGASKEYKAFVDACTKALPLIGFENGLKMFYPSQRAFTIPDYVAMGLRGSIITGLQVGLLFPLLLIETVRELLNLGGGGGADEEWDPVDYTPAYHALGAELRRGVEPDPPLPSRLQIEYELARWGSWSASWKNPSAIVPRSMYMAGYALGYAEQEQLSSLAVVVGDLHTMEIVRFLEGELPNHPIFSRARAMGSRSAGRRRVDLWLSKFRHLGVAGSIGGVILMAMFLGIYNALIYAGLL